MRRVVLEVDEVKLFDMLTENEKRIGVIGSNLVCICLSGENSFREDLRLEYYGIRVIEENEMKGKGDVGR